VGEGWAEKAKPSRRAGSEAAGSGGGGCVDREKAGVRSSDGGAAAGSGGGGVGLVRPSLTLEFGHFPRGRSHCGSGLGSALAEANVPVRPGARGFLRVAGRN
jgi:hypothetical protein